ncbi:MAG: DUF3277 family protein [Spirobacillus cienkowskii]|jgi:hypothetical protein|uniref:DUF3277 family protein n=1 Tax=Spirobacillus cienkowskii TaxID=495820 RepID=A0A369L1K1_9BACT|nr:MAG: DUF3277 family protein [Spirobacillus cienkowskii]
MAIATYSPKDVLVVVGIVPMTGFADGSFVDVEFNEEAFKQYVGSDGEHARTKNANESGKITIKLSQTSPCNDILSVIHIADKETGNGIVPISIKDNYGTSLVFAAECYIEKAPKLGYGKEIETREWVFYAAKIKMHVGGNNVYGQLYKGDK